jgi:hypothetical protein
MSIDWLDDLDLTVQKPPKVPKAQKAPRKEPFREIDLTCRYGYRREERVPAPRDLPKGGMIEQVIIENTELKNKEWKAAQAFAAKADRARMGAEYRADFIMGLMALAQEI